MGRLIKRINNLRELIAVVSPRFQNVDPSISDFKVDILYKKRSIPIRTKKAVNYEFFELGDYHDKIPLTDIFKILKKYDIVPLQRDGTLWMGFGDKEEKETEEVAECVSEEESKQFVSLDLAFKINTEYMSVRNYLILSWCMESIDQYKVLIRISPLD